MAVVSAESPAPVDAPRRAFQRQFGFVPTIDIAPSRRARASRPRLSERKPPGAKPAQLAFPFAAPPRVVQISGVATLGLTARARITIRSPALREYVPRPFIPRKALPGARPRSLGTRRLARKVSAEVAQDVGELAAAGYYVRDEQGKYEPGPLYPQLYSECEDLVPRVLEDGSKGWCPFVGCRYHLAIDVDEVTGAVKEMFPGVELDQMEETCALRFAEKQREDDEITPDAERTLERVGEIMNLTMESIRLTADAALAKLRRRT